MTASKTLRILVVDGHETVRRIVRQQLKALGYENVSEAGAVSDALALLKEQDYDLVIADWNMQPLGGLDLFKRIRSRPRRRGTAFILTGTDTQPEHIAAARDAGVTHYLVKPFDADLLRARLADALNVQDVLPA